MQGFFEGGIPNGGRGAGEPEAKRMVEASKVDPKTLSWQVQQVLLYEVMNVGELQKPGGGRYETPMGVALAEERALRTATQEQIATALLLWDERATPTTLPKCDATGYVSTL
jgi:hypothetical protein